MMNLIKRKLRSISKKRMERMQIQKKSNRSISPKKLSLSKLLQAMATLLHLPKMVISMPGVST